MRSSGHGSCRASKGHALHCMPWIHLCLLHRVVYHLYPLSGPLLKVQERHFAQRELQLPRCWCSFFLLKHNFLPVGDLAAVMRTPQVGTALRRGKKCTRLHQHVSFLSLLLSGCLLPRVFRPAKRRLHLGLGRCRPPWAQSGHGLGDGLGFGEPTGLGSADRAVDGALE